MDYVVDVIVRLRELSETLERLDLEDDAVMLQQMATDLAESRIEELRAAAERR